MKENVRFEGKYRVGTPCFDCLFKMKPCYEGLKEIGVDVDEIWKKMLGLRVNIGLLPLVLTISLKWKPVKKVWKKLELMLMRYEGKC